MAAMRRGHRRASPTRFDAIARRSARIAESGIDECHAQNAIPLTRRNIFQKPAC